jgi:hypothetical protein
MKWADGATMHPLAASSSYTLIDSISNKEGFH